MFSFKIRFLTVLSSLLLFGMATQAEVSYSMPSLEIGARLNTADQTGATSNKQSQAFQFGGSIVFNFGSDDVKNFGLKTGLSYIERSFKNETGSQKIEGKITYADVPLHFMFKFEDYAGIFIGPSLAMKMSDECTGCSSGAAGVKSSIMPITFGGQFKFSPNLGLTLFFEKAGDLATDIKDSRAIGLSLLLVFD
ncbi:MAG: hypothetical protein ACK4VO_04805 [Pseudobdellovibrio sp.]